LIQTFKQLIRPAGEPSSQRLKLGGHGSINVGTPILDDKRMLCGNGNSYIRAIHLFLDDDIAL
jgi:hypothetical protein